MSGAKAGSNSSDKASSDPGVFKLIKEFREQVKKGLPVTLDLGTISSIVDALKNKNAIDDRKMLLEHVLVLLSRLPKGELSTKLETAVVELLYLDLPHPPASYIGPQYQYRMADGSNNNISDPNMGKAGTPYSKSVQQIKALPAHVLPDPGLVFDVLLKREKFVKHPAGLSSLFFSFAALVIHSVFRTSHSDVNINETSSYVDLAPLYGNNHEAQNKVRVRDGRGLLHADTFAEDRLLLLPPAVCVLLVLFSRNHNYIARKLLQINERGTYIDPESISKDDTTTKERLLAQEEDIFQTARLINCGWFAGVVFSDYFSNILGLVRQGNTWVLSPFGEIRRDDRSLFERGKGNAVSVEFNCLYRWHATTSAEDEKWVEQIFAQMFPGKSPEQVTADEFRAVAKKLEAIEPDADHWTFGNLKRQEDGGFKDEDLANFLCNATEHPAGAFKARGTPAVMRLNEIMGIESNRRWGVCSLNDFRKFLGLKPYASFKEWNPDPEIADAAEKLYGVIDNLELYVGLQAEEAKPIIEGAGLCPGYTISRAILSDAIALTRGDRFFTSEYTPFNMTAWGFADCQRDATGPGFGSMLGRLLLRTLPLHYSPDSVYTWFPLITPDLMKINLDKLGDETKGKYAFERPKMGMPTRVVDEYDEIREILQHKGFCAAAAKQAEAIIAGRGFFLASSDPESAMQEHKEILAALVPDPESADRIAGFFFEKTTELIKKNSYASVGGKVKSVDIVRDVFKAVPMHWVATEIAGLPLKTKEDSEGTYLEEKLYEDLGDIYRYLFLDIDPSEAMVLQEKVKCSVDDLLKHIKSGLNGSSSNRRMSISGLLDRFSNIFTSGRKGAREGFLERFAKLGHNSDRIANAILAIMVGSTMELTQAFVHMINMYIDHHTTNDIRTSMLGASEKPNEVLEGYAHEAIRLDPPFAGVYRDSLISEALGMLSVQENERLFLNIANASMNETVFENPENVHPGRDKDIYLAGDGATRCLGKELTYKIMAQVLRAVFSLPNARRGPGTSGQLKRFRNVAKQAVRWEYLNENQQTSPWPQSMVIQYDEAT